jgi:hypothetical protein
MWWVPTIGGFGLAGRKKIRWFRDAYFAGDINVRKSTIVVIFFLVNSPITWQSTKQKVVAQFSYESEYIAAANVTCQVLWLARVLPEV